MDVSTLACNALSSGIMGGGGPEGFRGASSKSGGAGGCRVCCCSTMELLPDRKRLNQPLLLFDFLSSAMTLAVRLGGLDVFWSPAMDA